MRDKNISFYFYNFFFVQFILISQRVNWERTLMWTVILEFLFHIGIWEFYTDIFSSIFQDIHYVCSLLSLTLYRLLLWGNRKKIEKWKIYFVWVLTLRLNFPKILSHFLIPYLLEYKCILIRNCLMNFNT